MPSMNRPISARRTHTTERFAGRPSYSGAKLRPSSSVLQLRDCLEQLQQMMSAAEGRRSMFVWPSTPRIPFIRGVSRFRTAVDDYTVALDRIAASFHRLDQALAEFTAALRRIDQEYAAFFSVQLSNEPPQF